MNTSPHRPAPSTGRNPAQDRTVSLALRRAVVWAVASLALGTVFLAYLKPETIVTLANMVWSCF